MMFDTDEIARKMNGVVESPSAENAPVQTLYKNRNTRPRMYMFRY